MSGQRRFGAFNGLRACAALAVLAYHVGIAGGATRHGALAPVLAQLKGGVVVFFVITGTLLYLPYARAIAQSKPWPDWRTYARHRVLRILPAYWMALTVLGLGVAGDLGVFSANAWRYYGLAQIYDPETLMGGLGVAWTLCVEVSFYALLPLAAIGMAALANLRGRRSAGAQLVAIAALGAFSIVMRSVLAGSAVASVSNDHMVLVTALPGLLDWFALGMAIAVVCAQWEAGRRFAPPVEALASRPVACWVAAAACWLGAAALTPDDLFLPLGGLANHLALGVAAALFVLPAVHPAAERRRAGPIHLLTRPSVAWLGTVSYGIYLWHMIVLLVIHGSAPDPSGVVNWGSTAVLFVETAAATIALAALSWYLLERPAQRLGSRGGRRHAARAVLASVSEPEFVR